MIRDQIWAQIRMCMLNAPLESAAKKSRRVIGERKEIKVLEMRTAEQVLLKSFRIVQRHHPLIDVLPFKPKRRVRNTSSTRPLSQVSAVFGPPATVTRLNLYMFTTSPHCFVVHPPFHCDTVDTSFWIFPD